MFLTYEVLTAPDTLSAVVSSLTVSDQEKQRILRDIDICRDQRDPAKIANYYGLSVATIHRIKRTGRAVPRNATRKKK